MRVSASPYYVAWTDSGGRHAQGCATSVDAQAEYFRRALLDKGNTHVCLLQGNRGTAADLAVLS